jgi:2-polyprenyl-3-methyl-5-hydroxy-6-metoxy-1,4-benzoquinol methylase
MSINNLLEILECPGCRSGELLLPSAKNSLTCTNCNAIYPVDENIPSFIVQKDKTPPVASEIHKHQGTSFDYIDHYRKDAVEFDYFATRDNETEHIDRRVREYIATFISSGSGRILDTGCGKAWVSELFCPEGYNVVSLDISTENTSRAMKKFPFPNHAATVADVYSLPFKKNSFDFIVASEIIEHVVYPDIFIQNLIRVLKPGGILLITTPYKEKLSWSLCIHCNRPTPFNAHLHSFDEHKLESLYSGKDIKKFEFITFGNKILTHLRMNCILKYFNFRIWRSIDRLMNLIYNKPARILIRWEKSL